MIVPMFPLPEAFLFPHSIVPFHIFEPRYRQMIEDLLDTAGRLVVATIEPGWTGGLQGSPPVRPIAGLGEICGHERLEDGRYLIALTGQCRVRIEEVPNDRLYRTVETVPLEESPVAAERESEIRKRLVDAIITRSDGDVPGELPTARLADILLMQLDLPAVEMARAFESLDVTERAELALTGHAAKD